MDRSTEAVERSTASVDALTDACILQVKRHRVPQWNVPLRQWNVPLLQWTRSRMLVIYNTNALHCLSGAFHLNTNLCARRAAFDHFYHYGVSGCPQVAHYLGNDLIPHAMFRILIPSHSIAHSLGGKLTQKVGPNWANTCLQNTSQKATPTDPKSVLLKCPKN